MESYGECIVCNNHQVVPLACSHHVCFPCIINMYTGFETTKCPVCPQMIDINCILDMTLCARCKNAKAHYCEQCGNFLCDNCWGVIHSFKPADKHEKKTFPVNRELRRALLDNIEKTQIDIKHIDEDLSKLNNDGLKVVPVKYIALQQVIKVYNEYHEQLNGQQRVIEAYIEEQTADKLTSLLSEKLKFRGHHEICKSKLYEHEDSELTVEPLPSYESRLEYDLVMKSIKLPEIIGIPQKTEMITDGSGIQRWIINGQFHRDGDLPAVIHPSGRKEYYQNGRLHRYDDQPAITETDGRMEWYVNGLQHRDNDQPAVIQANGCRHWFKNGKTHRINDQPAYIHPNGDQIWYLYGMVHRDNDQPAQIYANGNRSWYQYNKLHRDNDQPASIIDDKQAWYTNGVLHRDNDQPALIYGTGHKEWYLNGKLHRINGPARIWPDGKQEWFHEGQLHRDNDQPAYINATGLKQWYIRGKLHRSNDQPAVIKPTGQQEWFLNGKRHRENGPAIIYPNGVKQCYINGVIKL